MVNLPDRDLHVVNGESDKRSNLVLLCKVSVLLIKSLIVRSPSFHDCIVSSPCV